MKKQTAVEWLEEKLIEAGLQFTKGEAVEIEQAKAMEKQQIIDAVNLPREKRWYNALLYNNSGEQYYNETYETSNI
jgi:hypothetical protein